MRYLVDLEKKEIVYDKELPAGHLIALKKIFVKQDYDFKEVDNLKTIIDLEAELSAAMKSVKGSYSSGPIMYGSPGGHVHTSGTGNVTESYRMDIMDFSNSEGSVVHDPLHHNPQFNTHLQYPRTPSECYNNNGKSLTKEQFDQVTHPADNSKEELKAEANKIKAEVEQAKKAFNLREELNALKAKLYSIL